MAINYTSVLVWPNNRTTFAGVTVIWIFDVGGMDVRKGGGGRNMNRTTENDGGVEGKKGTNWRAYFPFFPHHNNIGHCIGDLNFHSI